MPISTPLSFALSLCPTLCCLALRCGHAGISAWKAQLVCCMRVQLPVANLLPALPPRAAADSRETIITHWRRKAHAPEQHQSKACNAKQTEGELEQLAASCPCGCSHTSNLRYRARWAISFSSLAPVPCECFGFRDRNIW